ncbi:MAG: PRD domain-containing protein [Spirochaetaceae bacterium]|jgi:transcriptional antiterminator/mannitol/fructose-specific phosphotransferase system IIA component (Ntr-type)|nr:PRD domain-containing protein [Spirochaetaceae bacterium]
MTVTPRLSRLLDALLSEREPVSVDALAQVIGKSRRTVFRELENIDDILSRYNLELETESGKGLKLVCKDEDRGKLLELLRNTGRSGGRDKKERQLCLLIELLLNNGNIQKLFYYADKLGVSEATVSSDLDALEGYLKKHSILLIRRPGMGVYTVGDEEKIRTALTMRLFQDGAMRDDHSGQTGHSIEHFIDRFTGYAVENTGFPSANTARFVFGLIKKVRVKLDWMTEDSLALFVVFLAVSVERITQGNTLRSGKDIVPEKSSLQGRCAALIASEIGHHFALELPDEEIAQIARQIKTSRAKSISPLTPLSQAEKDHIELLTFRMIDMFDPKLAVTLKTNEELVEGLRAHLYPALARIGKGMELPDPFGGGLSAQKPELYEKTKRAARALETETGCPVNESEVSFIAIHFYAALLTLGEKNTHKRVLRAGIVCVSGIGASYMIASQMRKRYKGELEIQITSWNDREAWDECDFLVSTVPLSGVERPVVAVGTMLVEEDYRNIRDVINDNAFVEKKKSHSRTRDGLLGRIGHVEGFLRKTAALLRSFDVYPIGNACCFDDLALFCAEKCGETDHDKGMIFKNLRERETLFTQVIADLGIVLLHTRSEGVKEPVFAVVKPEGGRFLNEHFANCHSCVLMLLPQYTESDMARIMGNISAALVETPSFLEAVKAGNRNVIYSILEAELSDFLSGYCKDKLKN